MHATLLILVVIGAFALALFVAVGGAFVLVYLGAFMGMVLMVGVMTYSAFAALRRRLHHGWPTIHLPHLKLGGRHGNIRAA
jgi:hypothetical protein